MPVGISEQLGLDYEPRKETKAEKDARILRSTIEENLRGKNKKEKLTVIFFHSVSAQYFIATDQATFQQGLTEAMKEKIYLEVWEEILKIIKSSGFICTKGVEDEMNNLRAKIEKREKKAGRVKSHAEMSLAERDR